MILSSLTDNLVKHPNYLPVLGNLESCLPELVIMTAFFLILKY